MVSLGCSTFFEKLSSHLLFQSSSEGNIGIIFTPRFPSDNTVNRRVIQLIETLKPCLIFSEKVCKIVWNHPAHHIRIIVLVTAHLSFIGNDT
jgi:hypothetical protein